MLLCLPVAFSCKTLLWHLKHEHLTNGELIQDDHHEGHNYQKDKKKYWLI